MKCTILMLLSVVLMVPALSCAANHRLVPAIAFVIAASLVFGFGIWVEERQRS